MNLPPTSLVRRDDTHRLIPAKYGHQGDSVLVRIAATEDDLQKIFDLDNATNERLLAEDGFVSTPNRRAPPIK